MKDPRQLRPPELLTADHNVDAFNCGVPALTDWLARRAMGNQISGASRTYVALDGSKVVAYYSLAAGALSQELATGKVRRNMPEPIPVMILGRLAVDLSLHGQGVGTILLKHAIRRALQAADVIGIRAIVVHAISDDAKAFYQRFGFVESPLEPKILMITLSDAKAAAGIA